MKRILIALLVPLALVAVAVIDGAGRANLTGPDRRSAHTEIFVENSTEVAAGTDADETVTVNIVNRGETAEDYVWFLSIDGVELDTGSVTVPAGDKTKVELTMPDLAESALAEFSLVGKPQTLRWKVRGR
jgi:hypothetical protein